MASSLSGAYFIMFLLLAISCSVVVAFDGRLLSRICNGELYSIWDDHEQGVQETLDNLIDNTWNSSVKDYYCEHTGHGITVYGHGVCTSSLSPHDCRHCSHYARDKLTEECTRSVGAQVQLKDCRLRYEKYKFRNDG